MAIDAPGATQFGLLKEIFRARKEWWYLVPDQSSLTAGGNTSGTVLNLAARHKDGWWSMVDLGGRASFSVEMNPFAAGKKIVASWISIPGTLVRLQSGPSRIQIRERSRLPTAGRRPSELILEAWDG